ncbi:cytoskeleton protein RodZ [Streptococcus oricebi]|uniref:Helix-turn-helix domain-containing protein n=1 Tax=Streptococcus oricebi TaxID=1547447 RepID=A0ABS5B7X2_9STRE|nr:cytoskeleton protein RodZ [Streptococcus oricebi]MBP2624124.1 helix-turn-helix domain-containing protein [Streptococcus oricebi]
MRKKTIGEVLRLARINQGMSLQQLEKKTDIKLELLQALEEDRFDKLPSPFYARSFLRKYAWAVDLEEKLVLEAYEAGSMVTYDEIDVDINDQRSRKNRKGHTSYLPLFYFLMVSLAILAFVTYYVWGYLRQNQVNKLSSARYSLVKETSSSSKEEKTSSSSSSEATSSQEELVVSGGGASLTVILKGAKRPAKLKFSVSKTSNWLSVTETDLAGGITLSPEQTTASTELAVGSSSVINLGQVEGVTVTINDQVLDTSKLTGQTGIINLTIES